MAITPLPTPPSRQDPANFAARGDSFMAALPAFANEANALQADVTVSASIAQAAADMALANGNYKGLWSSLSGALTIPASVRHSGFIWMLLSDVANVALETPGISSTWMKVESAGNLGSAAYADVEDFQPAVGSLNGLLVADGVGNIVVADAEQVVASIGSEPVANAGYSVSSGFSQSSGSAPNNSQFTMRNRVIGHFESNQRALTSAPDDSYCLDRWYVLTGSGNVTVAQILDPESGAPWALRLTQPDAAPKHFGVATIIESKNIKMYRGQAMNLSMRAKPSFSGNVRYAIIEHTGTSDVVTSDVVNNWASSNFTAGNFFISGINIIKTGVISPGAATYGEINDYGVFGASLNNAILFVWSESPQGLGATLEINRPQFEPGVIKTPFEWRMDELELCKRYYEKSYDYGTPVGTSTSNSSEFSFGNLAGGVTHPLKFKTQKRTAPTIRLWDRNGNGPNSIITFTSGAIQTSRTPTVTNISTVRATVEVATSDVAIEFHYDASAEL